MKSKLKLTLIILTIMIICLSVGAYAAYTLTAKDVTYTKPDGTTVSVKEALDELRGEATSATVNISMTEAQSDNMFTKKTNSLVEDEYGNKIKIPAGFKIKVDSSTNDAKTADKGIVIIDKNDNEFVWIPTGTIYKNTEKTASETINLNRYTFDSNGNPTAQNDAEIDNYYQELETSTYGNVYAKDINNFKTKAAATGSGGFYIGRYEARTGTARSAYYDELTTLTTKSSDYVYNYVTQIQASLLSREMYQDAKTFKSDLMNSYAWDTATLFLQECGTNPTYSRKTSANTTSNGGLATTGTNNLETSDIECNVYDMASNVREWTTETSSATGRTDKTSLY